MVDAAKQEKFQYTKDIMNLLANKQVSVGDISIHLMKDKWLSPYEYEPDSFTVGKLDKVTCPLTYPLINHPSTLLLLQG